MPYSYELQQLQPACRAYWRRGGWTAAAAAAVRGKCECGRSRGSGEWWVGGKGRCGRDRPEGAAQRVCGVTHRPAGEVGGGTCRQRRLAALFAQCRPTAASRPLPLCEWARSVLMGRPRRNSDSHHCRRRCVLGEVESLAFPWTDRDHHIDCNEDAIEKDRRRAEGDVQAPAEAGDARDGRDEHGEEHDH